VNAAIPRHPLTLPDIIAAAFQVYVHDPLTFLVLALPKAAFVLALTLGNMAAFDALGLNDKASSDGNLGFGASLVTALALLTGLVLSIGADTFGDSFLVPAALARLQGKPAGAKSALACWRRLAGPALIVSLLIGVRVAAAALTLVLLPVAVFLYVRWSLAIPALVAERRGAGGSLARSAQLVSGGWWRVFGVIVAVAALTLAPQAGLQRAFSSADLVVSSAALFLAAWLVAPFAAIARTLLYLAVLQRKGSAAQPPTTLVS